MKLVMHFLVLSPRISNKVRFLWDLAKLYTVADILHEIKPLEIKPSFPGCDVSQRGLLMTRKGNHTKTAGYTAFAN